MQHSSSVGAHQPHSLNTIYINFERLFQHPGFWKKKCLAQVETVHSAAGGGDFWKSIFSCIWQLCEITTGPWRRRWGKKLNLKESSVLHPARQNFAVSLQINLKDVDNRTGPKAAGQRHRNRIAPDKFIFIPSSFGLDLIGRICVRVISHSIRSARRLEKHWNNPVGGGEKRALTTAWLHFFFKYNGLGNEPRKGNVVCLLLLKFTHGQEPPLSYCVTWILELAGTAFENRPRFWMWEMPGEQCAGARGASQGDDSSEGIVRAGVPSLSALSWHCFDGFTEKAAQAINPTTTQATPKSTRPSHGWQRQAASAVMSKAIQPVVEAHVMLSHLKAPFF